MSATPLFQKIDAVTVPVPDLEAGLRFYRDSLGHELRWRNDEVGQAAYDVHGNLHQGKVGVLCLAPQEGLGVRDEAQRAGHIDQINRFRGI